TPLDRWMGQPSVERPSETAGQGVFRAQHRIQVTAIGREPDALLLLPSPRAVNRREALRAGSGPSRVARPTCLGPGAERCSQ
ncbi:MAG TPA: hypothetical protein VH913_04830, partial [Hyphomicrobiaceae bacterium]